MFSSRLPAALAPNAITRAVSALRDRKVAFLDLTETNPTRVGVTYPPDVLRSLGFRVAVAAEVPYPGLPPGIVVRQTPQPGFQIAANETITLEVSK